MNITTSATFPIDVLEHSGITVVDFRADWCGPCNTLTPILEEFEKEYQSVRVVTVDVDQNPDLVMTYGIRSIPTIIVFENGTPKDKTIGLISKETLINIINPLLPTTSV